MKTHLEPRWPASLAFLTCVLLYVLLPNRLVIGPRWLIPALIVLVLIPLSLRRHRQPDDSPWVRRLTLSLITLITVANFTSMVLLVQRLLDTSVSQGRALIFSAVSVWLTNVIVYGVWFWEVDREGPTRRAGGRADVFDLQFPQMENPEYAPKEWRPKFTDYLYTSFANGTSFAPADVMPLTRRMKILFLTESLVSFVTIAVVAARAVNILN